MRGAGEEMEEQEMDQNKRHTLTFDFQHNGLCEDMSMQIEDREGTGWH